MGVSKLWDVIDPAKRSYTLEEICADRSVRDKRRELRIAIDVALWSFQAQSAKGGRRPQLRLMFYRFCRLYELGIRAVFVFDGPNRPTFKRDRTITTLPSNTEFRRTVMALAKLFNFFVWHANGEAEAECAALERLGLVDMVMTGDVDAFLFGARRLIRQWPAKRHSSVSCYDMAWISDATGLDRSDLILIALLRGNDYHHGGERIGIRVAEALARCKKHVPLMEAVQNAKEGDHRPISSDQNEQQQQHIEALSQQLIDDLQYELAHGCQGHLTKQYSQIDLDDGSFPDRRILDDFVHPETSITNTSASCLAKWTDSDSSVDLAEVAHFCKAAFGWSSSYTVRRFQNLLFHGYLNQRLRSLTSTPSNALTDPIQKRRRKTTESSSQLTQVDIGSFFGVSKDSSASSTPTPKSAKSLHPKPDIVSVRNHKGLGSCLMYLVDFAPHTLEEFSAVVRSKLDQPDDLYTSLFDGPCSQDTTTASQQTTEDAEDEDDTADPVKLCRKWVSAEFVQMAYPAMTSRYREASRKQGRVKPRSSKTLKKSATQTLLTDFIPKKIGGDPTIVLD